MKCAKIVVEGVDTGIYANMHNLQSEVFEQRWGQSDKIALLTTYADGKFPSEYVPGGFDTYNATVTHKSQPVRLELWNNIDIDLDLVRTVIYNNTDVFVVVYSTVHRISFQQVPVIVEKIRSKEKNVPILLVGQHIKWRDNKQLLDILSKRSESPVTSGEGQLLAVQIKANGFCECSALTGEGVTKMIDKAVELAINTKNTALGFSCINCNSCKVILLGHGSAGKTTLIQADKQDNIIAI